MTRNWKMAQPPTPEDGPQVMDCPKMLGPKRDPKVEHAVNLMRRKVDEEKPFLISFHYVSDGRVFHEFMMSQFPTGDLMKCVAYLEEEFVKILKRGSTGDGRMDPQSSEESV